jgi:serine/threonine-protein kinase
VAVLSFNAWNLIDAALIFSLAFGIYKKSRRCAVLMLVYFVGSKIIVIADTGRFSGAFLSIVFIYFYLQGVIGTFTYHKLLKQRDEA